MSLALLLPILPLYVQDIGGSEYQVGLVMGAFAIGLLGSRAWLGRLADRHSRKIVLLVGLSVAAIAPVGYAAIANVPLLVALRAFHGISIAAFATAYSTLVVDIAPIDQRGRLLGYMSLTNPLGVAIGPAIGGLLLAQVGYAPLFLLSALLGGIGWFCALWVYDPMMSQSRQVKAQAAASSAASDSIWRRLRSPRLHVPALILMLVGIAFGTIVAFLPLSLRQEGSSLNAGIFYTAAAIASFSMRLTTGRASDRLGRGPFITLSLMCYLSAMLCLWGTTSEVGIVVAGALEGSGGGMLIPVMAALIADRARDDERGRVFGLCMGGFDLGIAIAGPVLGAFAATLGYRTLFGLAACGLVLGLGLFLTRSSKSGRASLAFALGRGRDCYAVPSVPH